MFHRHDIQRGVIQLVIKGRERAETKESEAGVVLEQRYFFGGKEGHRMTFLSLLDHPSTNFSGIVLFTAEYRTQEHRPA